jgi:hypothetical protein
VAVLKGSPLDEGAQCNDCQTAYTHILNPYRHGAALDDMTNVNKNTMIFWAESDFLKYGRITREAYDEVRRLTVPRFAVLWEEGEPLPPPDVALVCRPCLGPGLKGGGALWVEADGATLHGLRKCLVAIVQPKALLCGLQSQMHAHE